MKEKEHISSENLFKAIYNDSPIGIELYDSKGKLIDLNQSCLDLFGVSSKDDVRGFDLLNDPNVPKIHLTKLKQRETVKFESAFDFDLVKEHKLYKTTKSGKIYIDVLITPLFLGKKKSISNFLVYIQDISDRKKVEHKIIDLNEVLEHKVQDRTNQLKKSEEDWRFLVEEAPDIIFTVDRNGRILYINKVPRDMTQEQAIGTDALDYVDPEYRKIVENSIENVFQTGESDFYEITARGPNDSIAWYSTRLGAIKQDEEVVSVMLITRDITERKKIEQKLKESEEKYRLITENLNDIITVVNEKGKVEYINEEAHKKVMGYSINDVMHKDVFRLIHPEDREKNMQEFKKSFTIGEGFIEARILHKDGHYVWTETNGKSFLDNDGKKKVITITRDITQRKKALEKLQESEEKFRTIADQSLVGITIAQNGIIKYVNSQMEELSGYSIEEMKSWNAGEFLKIVHPDYRELVAEQSKKKQMGQDDAIDQYQIKGIKMSGEHIWVDHYSKTIKYEGNVAVLSILIDITEKKEAKQKLKDSEERYRTLIDNILDIIFEIDLDGKITYLSPQTFDMLGYKPEEMINRNAFRFIHLDDQEKALKNQKFVIDSGEIRSIKIRIRHKEGHYITISSRGQLIEKEGEKKIIGLFRDVTEQMKIEEKVQEEKEKAEMYLNLVNVIIVALDKMGNISMINKKGYDILRWNEGDLIGKNWFENCLPLIDRERVLEYFKKLMDGEVNVVPFYENSVITKNGDEKLIAWSTILFRNSDGNLTGALSSGEDITERKRTEQALQESEEKFRTIAEQSLMGIIILQENKIKYVNSAAAAMLDYTVAEILSIYSGGFINLIYPTDRKIVLEQAKKRQMGIETYISGYECRCLKKNGEIIWIQNYSRTINFRGGIADLITVIDITDRKRAEEKIIDSEKRLMNLIEAVPVGISISTPEGNVIECNSNAFKIFGYNSKEEYMRTPAINYYSNPIDREKFLGLHKKGIVKDFEVQFSRKDGTIFWGTLSSVAQKMGDQTTFINSFQDITERKKTEIKIKQSEAELSAIYNYTPIAIFLLDSEHRIKKVNKFALKFTDRREEELFGIHGGEALRCLYSIKDPRGCGFSEKCKDCVIRNTVLDTFRSKSPHINVEVTLSLLPGNEVDNIHLLFSTVPLNVEGEDRVLVSMIDITEQKIAEQNLRESEKKYRTVITNIPGMVYRGYPDWTVKFISNSEVISGYTEEDFLSQKVNWIDIIHPNDRESIMKEGYLMAERSKSVSQIYRIFTKNGSIRWVNDRKISFFDKNGVFSGVDGIVYDITDYKLAEQKLKESEERFGYLISSSPAIIYTSKTSGDYGATYISDNVEEKWGYDPEIFVNDPEFWLNHVHHDDKEYVLEILSDLYDKDHITYEYRFKLNDDIYHWMRDEVMLIRDEHGNPKETIGSVIDITERVKMEQELKESEEKFRNIAEQTSLGLLIQQDEFIKFANSAVADMSEYSIQEINKWSVKDFIKIIHAEDLPLIYAKVNLVKSDDFDSSEQFECRLITKSGSIKWIEFITKPIFYLGKKAVFATLIDVTPKKKLEEELKEISKLKSELLSRTSHELKTPLVSIKGYADLLLSQHYEMLDIYTVSVLNEIKQGCYRLESLIKDLLETSKLESEEIVLYKSEDDLAFLIRFCIRDLRGLLDIRKHELFLDIQNNMITMMEKERIYEVIMNLLSNAIKYTPQNGQISIKSEIKDNRYLISIKDNGIGLTKDDKEKIFKKFGKIERYGKGMDVVSEGSGLGLYISKKIIELHDGEIWVESEGRDKGSTFNFSLPIIKK